MSKLTINELDSYKRQMEATIGNPQGLYIVSKINVVLSNLLKDDRFSKNEQLIEIFKEIKDMKEPNNYYTYKSEYPENFGRLQKLYPIVIDEIEKHL